RRAERLVKPGISPIFNLLAPDFSALTHVIKPFVHRTFTAMAKIDRLLTDSIVRKLPKPDKVKGNVITYEGGEDSAAGFGARVTAAGARSYVLRYYTRSGRDGVYTIGAVSDWTATAARKEARRLRHLVDQGGDPLGDLARERDAPTMKDLF